MKYQLPELPYSRTSFEGFLSEESFDFHYDKHHRAYIDKTNSLISGTRNAEKSLEDLLSQPGELDQKLFNNAAQAWNHTFYWHSLRPQKASIRPGGALAEALKKSFASTENFRKAWVDQGVAQFGSGWIWLVQDEKRNLSILTTGNADTPIARGLKPLVCSDVWEHAYYLDFRNARAKFLEGCFDHLNWEFAAKNYETPHAPQMGELMLAK